MAETVFVLDESRQWFIDEGRIDPMTRSHYKRGDRVVVCNACKMVSLESTWRDCGGCTAPYCGSKSTSRTFLSAPPPKPRIPADGLNRIILRNGGVDRAEEPSPRDGSTAPRMVIKKRYGGH